MFEQKSRRSWHLGDMVGKDEGGVYKDEVAAVQRVHTEDEDLRPYT